MRFVLSLKMLAIAVVAAAALAPQGAQAQAPVRIGQSIALSGVFEASSKEAIAGANAYLNRVNKGGGVNGRKLELKTLDDEFKPDKTDANLRLLATDNDVQAFFYPRGTAQAQAAIKVAESEKVPMVGMLSGAAVLREPVHPFVFHTKAGFANEAARMVKQVTIMGLERIAFFGQDDGLGKEGRAAVEAELTKRNLKLVHASLLAPNSVDVKAAIAALQQDKPQAVIIFAPAKPAAELIRQAKAASLSAIFIAYSGAGLSIIGKDLGDLARGVSATQIVPYPYSADRSLVKEYQADIKAMDPKMNFSYSSMDGYVAMRVLVEGIRRAGAAPTREKIRAALAQIQTLDIGGFQVSYSNGNNVATDWVDIVVVGAGGNIRR